MWSAEDLIALGGDIVNYPSASWMHCFHAARGFFNMPCKGLKAAVSGGQDLESPILVSLFSLLYSVFYCARTEEL